ncbi:MAG: NAD-dependent epimerase/dehydratase [Actinomycetia bacterium]|nr:NAD-dependent epimerase/dehydratase [Actinomycetes bacterium]
MRVLITGSSGQIGTNLALALLARGDEVHGIDRRPNTWTSEVPTEIVDLVELSARPGSWSPPWKPDCIVHLAAYAKVHELVLEPGKALENIQMASAALEVARATGSPVVFGSSREVYGDIHRHVTEEGMADFVVAESPYSASKLAGEALFYSYARCYELPVLVFRFSNVYGRYDNDEARMERVIPLFLKRIAAGEPIRVFGPGKMLDFTYVDDCVRGVVAGIDAITAGKIRTETVNVAYGQGSTLLDLVNLLELALDRTADVTYGDARVGEVTRYVADISKARALLGYQPQVPLTSGIRRYVAWWRELGLLP